jgi:hypothetical protein
LALDLQGNSINGTSTATFAGYGVSVLAVNVQGNNFNSNALADGTFSELNGDYVAVNFQSCNIGGTMTGQAKCLLVAVQLKCMFLTTPKQLYCGTVPPRGIAVPLTRTQS